MDEGGNYDKASSSQVPGCYNHESKDSTQVVYIYSTSSEIKREPGDQHSFDECRKKDESYGDSVYRKEENRVSWPQRCDDPDSMRAYGHDIDIDHERHSLRSDRFFNYAKSWGHEIRANNGESVENFRRDRSPNEATKCLSDRRKHIIRGNECDSNGSHHSLLPICDKNEDDRVSFLDRYYSGGYIRERKRRENCEENERSHWYRAESKQKSYEDNTRAGRKSFTPIRIYPHSKEICRERPYSHKKHEYKYGDAPPNVTLMGQGCRTSYEFRENRYYEDDMSHREPGNERMEGKLRSHKRIKCENVQEGINAASQRRDNEEFRSHLMEGKNCDENYDTERAGNEEIHRWERDFSRCKTTHKLQSDGSPERKESKYMREEGERRNSPDDYVKPGQREGHPRFACEIGGNKEPMLRYFECFGGHEYDYPRKCERYSELMHANENQRNSGKGLERRPMGANSPERDEKQIATQKEYVMAAYQRCCCPCCPCYSFFRQRQRDRSPVSPRRPSQKPSISPASTSRPPSHPTNEPAKARSSTIAQQMPPDLQLKMVARGLPHLRRRRNRTVYTHDQIEELEEVFKIKHYLDVDEKGSIAKRLGIRTENVEIWFKNRRAKWRKEMKSVKSNSDGETSQYLDEDESNNGEDTERFERKSLTSIFSKDIPEERPTMTLYHTGQDTCDNEVDSTVVVAAAT